ncbi:MAG TPA: hypothetical protein VGO93_05640 [Candidatus Xenobia bacterium]
MRKDWLAVALMGALSVSVSATASHHPHPAVHAAAKVSVTVGRHAVLTVCGVSTFDARKKAWQVQQRVDEALKWGIPPERIALRKVGHVLEVTWGGHVVATVDGLQARGHHMKPWALGNAWVSSLRHAAAEQTFNVSEKGVILAVGDTHALQLTGELAGPTTATVDGILVTAQVDNAGHQVTLKALHAGNAVVTLHRGHQQLPVKVAVRDLAGQVPAELSCVVTGDPAPRTVLNDALMYAIKGGVHPAAGAKIYVHGDPPLPDSLAAGQQATFTLPLSVEGAELLTVKRTVRVTVQNRPTMLSDASLLMVSNRPENVEGNGVIFSGKFGPGRPARLVYAHTNVGSQPRQICVTLTNRADRPAEVFLVGVAGAPQINPTVAGTASEAAFLQRSAASAGVILTIPPRTGWQVLQESIPAQQRLVGLAHLECLSGGDLEVTVQAREGNMPLAAAGQTTIGDNAASTDHPRGTFPSPNHPIQATYKTGDNPASVAVGDEAPPVDTASGERDTGNVGVLYHLTVKLSNPSDQARKVDIAYAAGDNPSRACFLIAGRTQETELVPANTEAPLQTIELGPNDTRNVELTTVGLPGAGLPAHIVLRTEPTAVSAAPALPGQPAAPTPETPGGPIITPGQPMQGAH